MQEKDFEFGFSISEDEQYEQEFEDIFSSSAKKDEQVFVDINSFSDNKKYKKSKQELFGKNGWWQRRKTWQKTVMISGVSLLLVFAILIGVLVTVFDYNYNSLKGEADDLGFENIIDKNIVNIALFGIDTRNLDSFKGNADSIMLLSLNTVTKKIKIVSLMRDTLVPIENNGKTTYGKINSAYSRGGPALAIKTINQVFGLDISEYATVNFYGMVDIIDAVGGIEAELTKGEVISANSSVRALNSVIKEICDSMDKNPKDYYITKPGKHKLNGIQAVAYSRIRYVANIWGTNNDYGRTDRQRYVMEQLFNRALTIPKKDYVKLARALIPCTETSLSYDEIMGLAFDILLDSPSFSQARIPQQEYLMRAPSTSAGSVVYYDLNFATKLIHAFFYDDITPDEYVQQNGIEKNDWYRDIFGHSSYNDTSSSEGSEGDISNEETSSEGKIGNEEDEQRDPNDQNDNIQEGDTSQETSSDDENIETDNPADSDKEEVSSETEGTSSDETVSDNEEGDQTQQEESTTP